jgi:hypothetical protein
MREPLGKPFDESFREPLAEPPTRACAIARPGVSFPSHSPFPFYIHIPHLWLGWSVCVVAAYFRSADRNARGEAERT